MTQSMNRLTDKKAYMSIKIYLAKAYDCLNWNFVSRVLLEVGIPSSLVGIICSCISSSSFQVIWNGSASDNFFPYRGIRQGDPLLPYLFVLCIDKLSHLIAKAVRNKGWKPMKAGRNGPLISHLMFANDLVLFGEASITQLEVAWRILNNREVLWVQVLVGKYERNNVGNENETFFWLDKWTNLDNPLIEYALPIVEIFDLEIKVADLVDPRSGVWNFELLHKWLPLEVVQAIRASLPPTDDRGEDCLVWREFVRSRYVVKSIYSNLMKFNSLVLDPIWNLKWKWRGPQRIRSFLWMVQNFNPPRPRIAWSAPCQGWWKLNCDVAVKRNQSFTCCGGLIRDDQGAWFTGFNYRIGICSPLMAELWAILVGLWVA
ncbi:uncharacterized protein LOC133300367 [Gastrolobium bilobum]|uniref:uncharacterized protein LOC133300367 n=1 Tax=Gastrolobium bilobum TaxID=150636 RepID=UPI002AB072A3|nr:uncharacterized protein LOC133300367 [Gastrolobium bilobum]